MTDYNELSDAETAALAFWGQDKWRKLRNNQRSHEERIQQLLAQSRNALIDDFFTDCSSNSDFDPSAYDYPAGSKLSTLVSSGDHVARALSTNSASQVYLRSAAGKLALKLTQDMAFFGEWRVKDVGGTPPDNILVGFTDQASASDETDCIAFVKGSTSGKWRFRVAKGNVGPGDVDNIGNRTVWQKLRIELLRSGGGTTFQARAFIDGTEIANSPFTTNLPDSVVLRAFWGCLAPASGTSDLRLDRVEVRPTAVPVNS